MSSKREVCIVITARPSYSRIKTAVRAVDEHPDLVLRLVVAGPALLKKYGNVVEYIERDGFSVNYKVSTMLEGENLSSSTKSVGLGIVELASTFDDLKPDMVITVADRFETISTAIASSFMNIPLVHIQGGEVTGSIDEKVRHSITKLSDLHLVRSEDAADRLYKMGEHKDSIFVTGCPSIDLAKEILKNPELDFNPFEKYGGVGSKFDYKEGYIVVMQHPVTTEYSDSFTQITETLFAAKELDLPTFWFWPNVDAGSDGTSHAIRDFREKYELPKIHFFKNMGPFDFLRLLKNSKGIIGNSSVAIRECSFLGVPAINIGTRQDGRIRGNNVIDTDYTKSSIIKNAKKFLGKSFEKEEIFGSGNSGKKIADILASFKFNIDKKIRY